MKNATELRNELSRIMRAAEAGAIDFKTSVSLANIAGKMISSAKVQVNYYELREEKPQIDFLKDDSAES